MNICLACMSVCLVLVEVRRWYQISWNEVCRQLWVTVCVLAIESWSSGRATSSLSLWTTSLNLGAIAGPPPPHLPFSGVLGLIEFEALWMWGMYYTTELLPQIFLLFFKWKSFFVCAFPCVITGMNITWYISRDQRTSLHVGFYLSLACFRVSCSLQHVSGLLAPWSSKIFLFLPPILP